MVAWKAWVRYSLWFTHKASSNISAKGKTKPIPGLEERNSYKDLSKNTFIQQLPENQVFIIFVLIKWNLIRLFMEIGKFTGMCD